MDFQKILSKLNEIEPAKAEVKQQSAPKQKVALAEDAQLRVLAGVSSILEEGRKISDRMKKKDEDKKDVKVDEMFNDEDPVGTKKKTSSGVATKTEKGLKHEKTYGKEADDEDEEKPAKKKTKESFRSKFEAMVEAKKDDADMKVGDKKKSSTGGTIEKTKAGVKHTAGKNYSGKAAEKEVKEGAKPDFLDIDKDGDKKEPMKKAAADKGGDKKDGKKGMSDKQAKYFGKKKSVKESVFEADQEGPADLLAAVEEEMNNPGRTVDNLRDVLNATFGSDRSPEFKKARAVIGKYLDLVDNAEMGSEEDGIAPMRGGNIARHIREYDLTDRLAHAAAMLDKVVGGRRSVKENDQEGPADLLAAVEQEMNNPGKTVDNLRDVMNATFGSDRSPEFKNARAVIGKYLDLIDNAEMGSEEDGIAPMRGGNIARHIQEYDLTDYLAHASSMLDKVVSGAMGESYKSKKKTVKESVEPKMGFREMIKLVIESGGQQQIDPVDTALWKWAQRVATSKVNEGSARDAMAAFVYERMGGSFQLYDVLSENKE